MRATRKVSKSDEYSVVELLSLLIRGSESQRTKKDPMANKTHVHTLDWKKRSLSKVN
jgi:hypothetical protein